MALSDVVTISGKTVSDIVALGVQHPGLTVDDDGSNNGTFQIDVTGARQGRVLMWYPNGVNQISDPTFATLQVHDPLTGLNNVAVGFAARHAEETGEDVYLILSAQSAAPISDWDVGQARWSDLETQVTQALSWVALRHGLGSVKLDALLWHHGHDTEAGADFDTYLEAHRTVISNLRGATTWFDTDTPIIAGELARQLQSGTIGRNDVIGLLPDVDPFVSVASSAGILSEDNSMIDDRFGFGYTRYWPKFQQLAETGNNSGPASRYTVPDAAPNNLWSDTGW